MFCLTSKWRQKLYTYEKIMKNISWKKSLHPLSIANVGILKGLTKLQLCLNHDDQCTIKIDCLWYKNERTITVVMPLNPISLLQNKYYRVSFPNLQTSHQSESRNSRYAWNKVGNPFLRPPGFFCVFSILNKFSIFFLNSNFSTIFENSNFL